MTTPVPQTPVPRWVSLIARALAIATLTGFVVVFGVGLDALIPGEAPNWAMIWWGMWAIELMIQAWRSGR
jgi:hypothetical protein